MTAFLAGLLCGTLSGLGAGGGSLLMMWMTGPGGLEQQTARGINLLFFLPAAGCALLFHGKNRLVSWKTALPAALAGCGTAALAAWASGFLEGALLRRLLGLFLVAAGLRELLSRGQRPLNQQ